MVGPRRAVVRGVAQVLQSQGEAWCPALWRLERRKGQCGYMPIPGVCACNHRISGGGEQPCLSGCVQVMRGPRKRWPGCFYYCFIVEVPAGYSAGPPFDLRGCYEVRFVFLLLTMKDSLEWWIQPGQRQRESSYLV